MEAIRTFVEVHPVALLIGALFVYGVLTMVVDGQVKRIAAPEDDGLPKDWPREWKERER